MSLNISFQESGIHMSLFHCRFLSGDFFFFGFLFSFRNHFLYQMYVIENDLNHLVPVLVNEPHPVFRKTDFMLRLLLKVYPRLPHHVNLNPFNPVFIFFSFHVSYLVLPVLHIHSSQPSAGCTVSAPTSWPPPPAPTA